MNKSIGEIVFGLLIVALGVGFLLDSLNVADFGNLIKTYWPLFIVGAGLASLFSNPRVFVWPLVIVAVGVLLQLRQLDVLTFNMWNLLWPVLVIVFGLSLLFEQTAKKSREIDDNKVDLLAVFSGNAARNVSSNFVGGKATAIFGGVELDLRDAHIKDTATIDIFAAFGGIEIKVPEGWNVKVRGLPILGGWEDKTRPPKDKSAPTLVIQGTCLCGGVEIRN